MGKEGEGTRALDLRSRKHRLTAEVTPLGFSAKFLDQLNIYANRSSQ